MKDGFLKAAAFSPALRVADCTYNAQQILADVQAAAARGVKLAVFPEFCLTGYTCGDLFLQHTLQTGALDALQTVLDGTRTLDTVVLVGLPLLIHGKLYNCAAVLCRGQLLGLVPKTYLPNYGEFYEKRQFTPGSTEVETITVCGQQVPFGTSLLFRCRSMPSFVLGVELCEDLWSALPPSTFHALAGATVIANLSASDETVGKAEYRRALVSNQSARLLCGYLYASAGHGESTQDMVFAGHEGCWVDPAGERGLGEFQIKLHRGVTIAAQLKAGVAGALGLHALAVDLGLGNAARKGSCLGQQGAVFGDQVVPGEHHVLGALTVAGRGVKVAAEQAGGLV